MSKPKMITIDGNEAVASVAYRTNEVIALYPITPASPMGEFSDEWAAKKMKNIWGNIPNVVEMQSEAGAVASVHGSLQAGALSTTFTASQGLLLMIPSLYKIAGELTSYCMHVSARTVASHALSIFGDHSDINSCRQIGVALLASGSIQEAHDMACIGQSATLRHRIPTIHFFDGFRSSHEVNKISELTDDDLRHMMPEEEIRAHRMRSLSPDRPIIRGTAQNPDAFFQAREACNPFYEKCAGIVQETMDAFAKRTGRRYNLFDYVGDPNAERVIVMMCSGAETAHEAVEHLNGKSEKVGLIKVRLYRPFDLKAFLDTLPKGVKSIAVLDRTKEPGAIGEPLYMDVVTALDEGRREGLTKLQPVVVGGRYGLSCKEFTPAMVKAVFDNLNEKKPKNHFTVGIYDDVTHTSLPFDREYDIEPEDVSRSVFFGLGADGTVGANKNSIKIIGEETPNFAQGYFVYDSKKAGAMTISHLRFGPREIRSTYLISRARFVACHHFPFMDQYDVLEYAVPGAVFLLNAPFGENEVWDKLPKEAQQQIIDKKLKFYSIDAYKVAGETGMGRRINTIMQTCFFAISGILPRDEAIAKIKETIEKTYSKKGAEVVKKNFEAVDKTLANMHEIKVPAKPTTGRARPPVVPENAPDFVKRVTAVMMENKGDLLPVSAFPVDGTWPMGTTKWEKRNVALEIPVWDPDICIQCNKCTLICPHAAIRAKLADPAALKNAPETFKSVDFKSKELPGLKYSLQVAPEDCTGCTICVEICPVKDKKNPKHKAIDMTPQLPLREQERTNFDFFLNLPEFDRSKLKLDLKGTQFLQPLFEYSGACAACGETPYVKLLTQLFGDRTLIANATGCSSIYGGNLPTTPYTTNPDGRGPSWSNSLFEDNAEFGFGFRLAIDAQRGVAENLLRSLAPKIGDNLVGALLEAQQATEADIAAQRGRVVELRKKLKEMKELEAKRLDLLADLLVKKSVWIVGGDGWAYDIGFGGLDHVFSMPQDVNILVLDTQVYSNTGGQQSKATPLGAAAKFAVAGKESLGKDLGLIAMSYGNVYVAQVAMGARDVQTIRAFQEADSYPGPSMIIAYSHCIAHGFDLAAGADHQRMAVDSGLWPLYTYDPRRTAEGKPPLKLDSAAPKISTEELVKSEVRYKMPAKMRESEDYKKLVASIQVAADRRFKMYQQLSAIAVTGDGK